MARLFLTRRWEGAVGSSDEEYSLPDDTLMPLDSLEELELDPLELAELLLFEEVLLSPFEFGVELQSS